MDFDKFQEKCKNRQKINFSHFLEDFRRENVNFDKFQEKCRNRPPIAKRSRKSVHNPLLNMKKTFKSPTDCQSFTKEYTQPVTKHDIIFQVTTDCQAVTKNFPQPLTEDGKTNKVANRLPSVRERVYVTPY